MDTLEITRLLAQQQQQQQEQQEQQQQVMPQAQMYEQARMNLQEQQFKARKKIAKASRNRSLGRDEAPTVFVTATARESRLDRKKRESQQTKINKAIIAAKSARQAAVDSEVQADSVNGQSIYLRMLNEIQISDADQRQYIQNQGEVLDKKLEAIKLQEQARLLIAEQMKKPGMMFSDNGHDLTNEQSYATMVLRGDDKLWEDMPKEDVEKRRELRIKIDSLDQRIAALDDFGKLLPLGSSERIEIMKKKEAAVVERYKLNRQRKVLGMTNQEERRREESTISRHGFYDFASAVVGKFRRQNPYSVEGAKVVHPGTHHVLINVGRATFGGTKPMYIFKDLNSDKEYLFKEPVNCCGLYKAQGALVTSAAATLQEYLRGEQSIPAFTVMEGDTVMGSLQERVESYQGPVHSRQPAKVDLFEWQARRQQNPGVDADDASVNGSGNVLSKDMKRDILREHVLDWALCNFDTKGENFLQDPQGRLVSFDKEASFSKIKEAEAQHMSTDYVPHSNDTIYNTIFKDFANNKIDLDLNSVMEPLVRLMELTSQEYREMFNDMLNRKYDDEQKRNEVFERIDQRRKDMVKEYRAFFGKLVEDRKAARRESGEEPEPQHDVALAALEELERSLERAAAAGIENEDSFLLD